MEAIKAKNIIVTEVERNLRDMMCSFSRYRCDNFLLFDMKFELPANISVWVAHFRSSIVLHERAERILTSKYHEIITELSQFDNKGTRCH